MKLKISFGTQYKTKIFLGSLLNLLGTIFFILAIILSSIESGALVFFLSMFFALMLLVPGLYLIATRNKEESNIVNCKDYEVI